MTMGRVIVGWSLYPYATVLELGAPVGFRIQRIKEDVREQR